MDYRVKLGPKHRETLGITLLSLFLFPTASKKVFTMAFCGHVDCNKGIAFSTEEDRFGEFWDSD
jgi:hypothetical protein